MNIEKLFKEFPIIDCGQYILRQITESDADDIYEIYSDYENVIYDRKKPFISLEETTDYIKRVGAMSRKSEPINNFVYSKFPLGNNE